MGLGAAASLEGGEGFFDGDATLSVVAFAAEVLLAAVSEALDVVALVGCGADLDLAAVVDLDLAFCDGDVDACSCITGVGAEVGVEAGIFETGAGLGVAADCSCGSSCGALLSTRLFFIEETEDGVARG